MRKALTIAGSDCSGGAGIQADLKAFSAHGVYGMSAIVSVVAENTARVIDIFDVSPDMIAKQIDAVYGDAFPTLLYGCRRGKNPGISDAEGGHRPGHVRQKWMPADGPGRNRPADRNGHPACLPAHPQYPGSGKNFRDTDT